MPSSASTPVTPSLVFQPWEAVVDSWRSLCEVIDTIHRIHTSGGQSVVWRGVADAGWALQSSLYRRLKAKNPTAKITEEVMRQQEKKILDTARHRWRLDNLSALEILAHIQHYGGPTRLLDVTHSPLAAAWFATEQQFDKSTGEPVFDKDGRIFCFYVGEQIELDEIWGGRHLAWTDWSASQREANSWGSGAKRRFWNPPAYNSRISAQNAGFILDGIFVALAGGNIFSKAPGSTDRWRADELRTVSSIPIRLNQIDRAPMPDSKPMFTIRVTKDAMADIRQRLERTYGLSSSSMYPDLFGLGQRVAPDLPTG